MKREDIAQAFHLMAMGRANHPLQVELIDALAKLLDKPEPVKAAEVIEVEVKNNKLLYKPAADGDARAFSPDDVITSADVGGAMLIMPKKAKAK